MDFPNPEARTRKTDRRSFRLGSGEFERVPERVEVLLPVIRGQGEPKRITVGGGARPSVWSARKLFFEACAEVQADFLGGSERRGENGFAGSRPGCAGAFEGRRLTRTRRQDRLGGQAKT